MRRLWVRPRPSNIQVSHSGTAIWSWKLGVGCWVLASRSRTVRPFHHWIPGVLRTCASNGGPDSSACAGERACSAHVSAPPPAAVRRTAGGFSHGVKRERREGGANRKLEACATSRGALTCALQACGVTRRHAAGAGTTGPRTRAYVGRSLAAMHRRSNREHAAHLALIRNVRYPMMGWCPVDPLGLSLSVCWIERGLDTVTVWPQVLVLHVSGSGLLRICPS